MQLSINPAISNRNVNFKGELTKTKEGNTYYHSNTGTKMGSLIAIPAALNFLKHSWVEPNINDINIDNQDFKEFQEFLGMNSYTKEDFIKTEFQQQKKLKKNAIPYAIIAAGITAGSGVLVDKIRNKKAMETADQIKKLGLNKAIDSNYKIRTNDNNKGYYKSNIGTKNGFLLGTIAGIANAKMHSLKGNKIDINPYLYLTSILTFSIGGTIVGAINDHLTNNEAKNNANI